jgi:predicted porin
MYSLGFNYGIWADVTGTNVLGADLSQATAVNSTADTTGATSGVTTSAYKMNANSQKYVSPRTNGVQVTLYNVTNAIAASGAGKVQAAEVDYVRGNFEARGMYEVKQVATSGPITKHTSVGAGAGYNFGIAKVRAATQRGTLDSTSASGNGVVTVTKLTAIAPATPVLDVWGGYVLLSENSAGSMYSSTADSTARASYMVAGATYKLSKRTNVYAYYAGLDNKDSTAKFGRSSAVGTVTFDPNSMGMGMRHSF